MVLIRSCLIVVTLIFVGFESHAQVTSDFAANVDGWTVTNATPAGLQHSATGGNPNPSTGNLATGYAFAQPQFFNTLGASVFWVPEFFQAPVKFEGNLRVPVDYYDGTLRFDLSQATTGAAYTTTATVIMTTNAGVSYYWYPYTAITPPAFGSWQMVSVRLSNQGAAGAWRTANADTAPFATEAQLQAALTTLQTLQIKGLYQNSQVVTRIDNVTLFPPIRITIEPDDQSVCAGQTATVFTAAEANSSISYHWQAAGFQGLFFDVNNGGGFTGATTQTLSIATTPTFGENAYRCRISGVGVEDAYTVSIGVEVNPIPNPPSPNNQTPLTFCAPQSFTLSVCCGDDNQFNWYNVPTGGTSLMNSNTFVTPVVSQTTTFYATYNDGQCESTRLPVVTSYIGPQNPVVTTPGSCEPGPVTLTATGGAEGQFRWYESTIVKSPISGATGSSFITPSLTTTTTFYVTLTQNQCESPRIPVEAVIGGTACQNSGLNIYTAVSPNKDGKNEVFWIENIDKRSDSRKNTVSIFNRWGDLVWEGKDYNNTTVVFAGFSKNNTELPSGTYYFKIEFESGKTTETGYLSLKR